MDGRCSAPAPFVHAWGSGSGSGSGSGGARPAPPLPPAALQSVSGSLGQQRALFEGVGGKLGALGAKFPVVNTLLNAVRRRKNRVRALQRSAAWHLPALSGLPSAVCCGRGHAAPLI